MYLTGYKGETIEIKISNKCCTISLVQDWQGYKIQKNWSVFERLPDKPINEKISENFFSSSISQSVFESCYPGGNNPRNQSAARLAGPGI